MTENQWKKPKDIGGVLQWKTGLTWRDVYFQVSTDTICLYPKSRKDGNQVLNQISFTEIDEIRETGAKFSKRGFKIVLKTGITEQFKCSNMGSSEMQQWIEKLRHALMFWTYKENLQQRGGRQRKITLEGPDEASKCVDLDKHRVFFTLWNGEMIGLLLNSKSTFSEVYPRFFSFACQPSACGVCKIRHRSCDLWAVDTTGTARRVAKDELLSKLDKAGNSLFVMEHHQQLLVVHFSDFSYEIVLVPAAITAKEVLKLEQVSSKLNELGCLDPGLFLRHVNGDELQFCMNENPFRYRYDEYVGKIVARSRLIRANSVDKSDAEKIAKLRWEEWLRYVQRQREDKESRISCANQIEKSLKADEELCFFDEHFALKDDKMGRAGHVQMRARARQTTAKRNEGGSPYTGGIVGCHDDGHCKTLDVPHTPSLSTQPSVDTGCKSASNDDITPITSSDNGGAKNRGDIIEAAVCADMNLPGSSHIASGCDSKLEDSLGSKNSDDAESLTERTDKIATNDGNGEVCDMVGNAATSSSTRATSQKDNIVSELPHGVSTTAAHSDGNFVETINNRDESSPNCTAHNMITDGALTTTNNNDVNVVDSPDHTLIKNCHDGTNLSGSNGVNAQNSDDTMVHSSDQTLVKNSHDEISTDVCTKNNDDERVVNSEHHVMVKNSNDATTQNSSEDTGLERDACNNVMETTNSSADPNPDPNPPNDHKCAETTPNVTSYYQGGTEVPASGYFIAPSTKPVSDQTGVDAQRGIERLRRFKSLEQEGSGLIHRRSDGAVFQKERQKYKENLDRSPANRIGLRRALSDLNIRYSSLTTSKPRSMSESDLLDSDDVLRVSDVYPRKESSDDSEVSDDDGFRGTPVSTFTGPTWSFAKRVEEAVRKILEVKGDPSRVERVIGGELCKVLFELLNHGLKRNFLGISFFSIGSNVWDVCQNVCKITNVGVDVIKRIRDGAIEEKFHVFVHECIRRKILSRWFELLSTEEVQKRIMKYYEPHAVVLEPEHSKAMEHLKLYLDRLSGLKLKALKLRERREEDHSAFLISFGD